jgi:ankyrin repeat protein
MISKANAPLMAFIGNDLLPKPERKISAVVQFVIDAGASVHRRNRKGETALHFAMRLGRPAAVEVLVRIMLTSIRERGMVRAF